MLSRWIEAGREYARLHPRRVALIGVAFFVLVTLDGLYGVVFRGVWINGMMPVWALGALGAFLCIVLALRGNSPQGDGSARR
jgi:hypothetical protein